MNSQKSGGLRSSGCWRGVLVSGLGVHTCFSSASAQLVPAGEPGRVTKTKSLKPPRWRAGFEAESMLLTVFFACDVSGPLYFKSNLRGAGAEEL